jgi:ribosomal protein S18 acetylase RimI-like enzyme
MPGIWERKRDEDSIAIRESLRKRMSDETVQFREASPGDVEEAVPLIHSSGPAAFDFVFSRKAGQSLEFLHFAFLDGAGEMGYKNHIVGEQNGKVVAIGAAFDGSTGFPFFLSAARQIISFYGFSCLPAMIRGLQVEQMIEPPKGRLHYIAHLGVRPDMQGKGVGSKLVEHLLERGRKEGRTQAALDVSTINPRAQALYERFGFQVTKHNNSTLPGVPSHNRMERAL